jgi:hypothetical protein
MPRPNKQRELPPQFWTPQRQWYLAAILFALAVGLLAVYHRLQYNWVLGDENEHLYVAHRIASGVALYGGIHSARPPLIFAPVVALLHLGLPLLLAARLCVVLAEVATAGVLWWIGWRLWGLWEGLAAAVLFLTSSDVAAMFPFVGIQQTSLLALLCLALRLTGAPAWAGAVGGLAIASGQHSAVIVAVTALYQIRSKPKGTAYFVLGVLGVLVATVGFYVARGGTGMWQDLIGHHLIHVAGRRIEAQVQSFQWRLGLWSTTNLGLLVLAGTAAVVGLNDPRTRFWTLVTVLHLVAVMTMNFGKIMYLFPAVPLLAALAGPGLTHVIRKLKLWAPARGWRWPSPPTAFVALLYVLIAGAGQWMAKAISDEHFHEDFSFWPHLRELELNRGADMTPANRVAEVVSQGSTPGTTLFGGSPALVSYVALAAGTRVSAELADLDTQWVIDGRVPMSSVISQIEHDGVQFFLDDENGYFLFSKKFEKYLADCYEKDPYFFPPVPGYKMGQLILFPHKPVHPCE